MAENNTNEQDDWSAGDLAEKVLKATFGWWVHNLIKEAKKQ